MQPVHTDTAAIGCKKFPYLVYYERVGVTVHFLAVLYAGRAPGLLRETLTRYRNER